MKSEDHILSAEWQDEVLTVKEVSDHFKLAESTIYKLVQEGTLPGRKIGGTWRFSRNQLQKWLEESSAGH